MRRASIQVEIREDPDGCFILVFTGKYGDKFREVLPVTQAGLRANKYLYQTLRSLLDQYCGGPATVEGGIVHEEE